MSFLQLQFSFNYSCALNACFSCLSRAPEPQPFILNDTDSDGSYLLPWKIAFLDSTLESFLTLCFVCFRNRQMWCIWYLYKTDKMCFALCFALIWFKCRIGFIVGFIWKKNLPVSCVVPATGGWRMRMMRAVEWRMKVKAGALGGVFTRQGIQRSWTTPRPGGTDTTPAVT